MNDENSPLQIEDGRSQRSGTDLLADPAKVPADLKMIRKAVRDGWNIPKGVRKIVMRRLVGIIKKRSVRVVTKDGIAHIDGPADANAIAAVRALVAMNGQDQADDHKGTPDEHHHAHDVNVMQIAEQMSRDPNYLEFLRQQAEREDAVVIEGCTVPQDTHVKTLLTVDERRKQLSGLLATLRDRGGTGADSGTR